MERKLAPTYTARFDWNGRPDGCLPDTRIELLEQIRAWITNESTTDIFFLTGLAGTGKTTIAQSVCIHFDGNRPMVSFFISRHAADRRSPTKILHSIIYQLGIQDQRVASAIGDALRNGREVETRPLAEQVESLFEEPLKSFDASKPPLLIVIDALDECDQVSGREGGDLIPLIARCIFKLPGRVKLFITSREEPAIMAMLPGMRLKERDNLVRLQKIEDSVVRGDIETFYTYHFHIISQRRGFKDTETWPSKQDFDLLVNMTGKLFVYASLVIRLVSTPRVDPKQRLQEIIHPSGSLVGSSTFEALDELYTAVLTKATSVGEKNADKEVIERVRQVVGALVLSQYPLNAFILSELLGKDITLIQEDIQHLSAVLLIPDDVQDCVSIFHPSFSDFVLVRCMNPCFKIDPSIYNAFLARQCLHIMNHRLRHDICDIKDASVMNADVEDLKKRLEEYVPHVLQYSCEYWMVHMANASHSDKELLTELESFCDNHLLHWIETLSLLEKLSAAQIYLPSAIGWCKVSICLIPPKRELMMGDRGIQLQLHSGKPKCLKTLNASFRPMIYQLKPVHCRFTVLFLALCQTVIC